MQTCQPSPQKRLRKTMVLERAKQKRSAGSKCSARCPKRRIFPPTWDRAIRLRKRTSCEFNKRSTARILSRANAGSPPSGKSEAADVTFFCISRLERSLRKLSPSGHRTLLSKSFGTPIDPPVAVQQNRVQLG